jgi:thiosulfate/3-mercaptopyruvate sulfurtransferase
VYSTLIDAATLRDRLNAPGWCIVDCRANLADHGAGPRDYAGGHIPRAYHAHLENDLADPPRPGISGRHPLPDRARLRATFAAWGVKSSSQLIVYDADSGMFAARLWWLARWLGHSRVAVLDGGWSAWRNAGFATSTDAPPARTLPNASYPEQAPLTALVEAQELLEDRADRAMLDARSSERFAGHNETIDPVGGHIPGAQCMPFQGNLNADLCFLAPHHLRQRFTPAVGDATQVVCYCGSGITAAHNILALRIAGFDEPALYAGSWSEWIQDPTRPRQS